MTAKHEVRFLPNPTQYQFIHARSRADLFASRVGEGKSAALCWACFWHTLQNPGARWALIRDTWINLQATTQREFFKWFPPGIFGRYEASRHLFVWDVHINGAHMTGEVEFLGIEDDTDVSKLMSRELAGFGIDEPAPATSSGGVSEFVFDMAMTRLRQPGMEWYSAKLAENNPDEGHWTYRRFVDPGEKDFTCWQTKAPENLANLPVNYYENLKGQLKARPDLIRRFLEGKFGFQQIGRAVTPEWSDEMHLAPGIEPVKGLGVVLCWDFGLTPACIVTQVTPLGDWLILDAFVGDSIGVLELIETVVQPNLALRYPWLRGRKERPLIRHVGDPAGLNREQSSSLNSAALVVRKLLGGVFHPGPVRVEERVEPMRVVLRRTRKDGPNGLVHGVLRVDPERAKAVWHALRGGWHYRVHPNGTLGEIEKNDHSHPADALSYGSAVLFPMGKFGERKAGLDIQTAEYFGSGTKRDRPLGFERPGMKLPAHGAALRSRLP